MHVAASAGSMEVVGCLVELGADASPLDSSGSTPLDDAKKQSHDEVCLLLEAHGAYLGASFRQLARDSSPTSVRSDPTSLKALGTRLAVPLSVGRGASNFDTITRSGLVFLGGADAAARPRSSPRPHHRSCAPEASRDARRWRLC